MTKAEIVKEIANKTGVDKQTVLAVIESFMTEVKGSLFIVKKRAEKTARNISKNTTMIVPAHNIPAFKPSKEFESMMK